MVAPSARQIYPEGTGIFSLAPKQAIPGLFLRDTALARRHAIHGMLILFPIEFVRKLNWKKYN